jgi:tetratricopeptide (TPR) repeat protein
MNKTWLKYLPAILGFVLYMGSIGHGYVLDDNLIITKNSYVQQGFSGIADIVTHNYANGFENFNDGLYRPLSVVSFAIEHAILGENSAISHFINALLYGLALYFLTVFLSALTKQEKLAILIALLYAIHPIHTEVVANLKGRDEIMALLFISAASTLFLRYVKHNNFKQLALFSSVFTLALFSKESAVTYTAVFALLFWFLKVERQQILKLSAAISLPVILFLMVRALVLSNAGDVDTGVSNLLQNPLIENDGLIERLSTASSIQWIYYQRLFFPINLVHDYSFSAIPVTTFNGLASILGFLLTLSFLVLGVYGTIKRKLWGFGIIFYFITIAVVANVFILIGAIAAERFLFLPSLGWAIAVGSLVYQIKNEKAALGLVAATCLIFSVLTVNRAKDWDSNFTLFTGDVDKADQSARAHYNAATAFNNEAKREPRMAANYRSEAIKHHKKAIEIWPEYQDAYNNLAIVYMESGKFDAAIDVLKTMLTRYPSYNKAYYNLCVSAFNAKDYALAEQSGETYFGQNPNNEILYLIAEAEGFQGKFDEAEQHLQQLIQLEPNKSRGYLKIGMAKAITNKLNDAIYYLDLGLQKDPRNTEILFNLALIYNNTGNAQSALSYLNQLLVIEPQNQRALGLINQIAR